MTQPEPFSYDSLPDLSQMHDYVLNSTYNSVRAVSNRTADSENLRCREGSRFTLHSPDQPSLDLSGSRPLPNKVRIVPPPTSATWAGAGAGVTFSDLLTRQTRGR